MVSLRGRRMTMDKGITLPLDMLFGFDELYIGMTVWVRIGNLRHNCTLMSYDEKRVNLRINKKYAIPQGK